MGGKNESLLEITILVSVKVIVPKVIVPYALHIHSTINREIGQEVFFSSLHSPSPSS